MDHLMQSKNPDEDDDPIIKVIPIIHANRLENSLNLFQYPLRRNDCTDEHKILKCCYKPHNEEVKLELNINTESPNFDTGRAEIIAQEVDGNDPSKKDAFFKSGVVDRVFLQSLKPVANCRKYASATFNGKEIHLTSLKGIYEFRPHFPYLDHTMKRKRDAELDQEALDEEEAGPSTAQQVTVKFQSVDERSKKPKENDYKAMLARSAQEAWIDCKWYDQDTPFSSVEKLKLFADCMDDTGQASGLSKQEYLRLLVPEDKEQVPLEPTLPSHLLSLHALRALPLLEQCRALLKHAQILQFQQLVLSLAGGEGFSPEALLKTLPEIAVLVRGNWVVKSEVLYPDDTCSAISGVPAELMCRARDYILYLFTKNQYVERKKVSPMLKIPSEEVKEIFTGISKQHNKAWELHVPTDHEFINKHSDLVSKQDSFWKHRFDQLTEFLKNSKTQRRKSKSESKSFSEDSKCKNGLSFSSDNDSGTEKNNMSPVAGRKNKSLKVLNQITTDVSS